MLQEELEHMKILDYRTGSSFCRANSKHGGSVIMYSPSWEIKAHERITNVSVEEHCEVSATEIKKMNLIVITVYRPPNGDYNIFLDVINSILDVSLSLKKYVLLNGDFNIHFDREYNLKHKFLDLINSYSFIEKVFRNTRKDHRLDNVFINFESVCECTVNVFNPNLSDHDGAIECKINIENLTAKSDNPINNQHFYRPTTKKGIVEMGDLLRNESWSFLESDSAVLSFTKFFQIFLSYRDAAFPLSKYKPTKNAQEPGAEWFGEELQVLRRELQILSDMSRETECQRLQAERNALRNRYRTEINNSKKQANSNYIRNSDNITKASWKLIKKHTPKGNPKPSMNINPNEYNDYFADIAENLIKALPTANSSPLLHLQNSNLRNQNLNFSFVEVNSHEILQALNSLKKKHSRDCYDLNVVMIQALGELLCVPLAKLFNKCIQQGAYPRELKISKTVPIFKTGDKTLPSNYRPVSLIPVFSKIFEVLLKNQLYSYFEENNLFMDEQFGFRKGKSTTGAILRLCDFIVEGFEEEQIVASTFCDLSKAFDCVSHDILTEKLKYYGLNNTSTKLISEYLLDRRQITEIEGRRSEERVMNHGVVQGSILGPLLFLIYINDLSSALSECHVVVYADDNGFSIKSKSPEKAKMEMTRHVETAYDWFNSNLLNVNQSKTENMVFSLKKTSIPDNPTRIKFLGVTIDAKLTFEHHVNVITKKLCSATYVLRNISKIVDRETTKMAYYGLFHSVCTYGLLAWGHSSHAARVFSLQRRAVRIVAGVKYRDDVRPFFISLKILTIPCQYILECLLYIYKNSSCYTLVEETHSYNTRHRFDVQMDFLRLRTSCNATRHFAPAFFNRLPLRIRNMPLKQFKNKIKQFLLNKGFYSVDEFLRYQIVDSEF